MEITNINAFFDLIVISEATEDFADLEVESDKGLIVLFDAMKVTNAESETLSNVVWEKLMEAKSKRLHALDFVSNFAGVMQAPVPISVVKANLIDTYQDLATKTLLEIQEGADRG